MEGMTPSGCTVERSTLHILPMKSSLHVISLKLFDWSGGRGNQKVSGQITACRSVHVPSECVCKLTKKWRGVF